MNHMPQIKQPGTHRDQSFPFLSGVLALDLINTDILLRGKRHDFLTSPEAAAEWWRQASELFPERARVEDDEELTRWNPALLEELKRLRGTLRHLFLALIEQQPLKAEDLAEFNRRLALGYHVVSLNETGEATSRYHTTEPAIGAILLPLALSAFEIMTRYERSRLHKCANERCIGLFYDTTRSATRHWCSPECMNRARSHQHYQQLKAQKVSSKDV
jgi:predicted RNA-binding Zn ribbon-like protein